MRRFRTLTTGALVLGLAAPAFAAHAFAAGPGEGPNHQLMFAAPGSHITTMTVESETQQKLLMQGAKPLAPGSIVYSSDGVLYLVQDHAMPDGKMLSATIMNGN